MLEKVTSVDLIEVIENGLIQVRTKTAIKEDVKELAEGVEKIAKKLAKKVEEEVEDVAEKIAEEEFNHPYINFYFHKKDADLIATFNKPLALKKYKEALIELIVFKTTSPEYNNYKPMITYNEKYLVQKIAELEGLK
jgi:hypothetical protein